MTDTHSQLLKLYSERPKKEKVIDPDLQRDLQSGWLLPYLVELDDLTWGRWDYWCHIKMMARLPDTPIPQISFGSNKSGFKMLQDCIDALNRRGGVDFYEAHKYIIEWALWGFGYLQDEPRPVCNGASMLLYQLFDLTPLMLYPYDYWGDLVAGSKVGKERGFFPTPHHVVELMTQVTMGAGEDKRAKAVNDPCVGTGRMLLHASNYSLNLWGMDISRDACQTTIFNGFLYAPWLVKSFYWSSDGQILRHPEPEVELEPLVSEPVLMPIQKPDCPDWQQLELF